MLAVRAVCLRITPLGITPLGITPLVSLAVPAVVAGGWLVRTVAALAALSPPMPPPLGGLCSRRPRPDACLRARGVRRRRPPRRVRYIAPLRGAPVPPPPLTAAAA